VNDLSENVKLRFEQSRETVASPASPPSPVEPVQLDDAETQMRRALGLHEEAPRHRTESERIDPPVRTPDRYGSSIHRRRFVQDGEIPVTVVRRDPGSETLSARTAPTAPSSSRLQRAEMALATELAARDRAERALGEAQALIRDLQTKLGHAELAKDEVARTVAQEREASASLYAAASAHENRLTESLSRASAAEESVRSLQAALADERAMRKTTERALRSAEAGREAAELLLAELSGRGPAPVDPAPAERTQPAPRARVSASAKRTRTVPEVSESEPEPVKWWLTPKPAGKRR
jgi:hypothetical protein